VDWAAVNAEAIQLYGNWKEFSWWGRAMGSPKLRPDSPTTQLPDPLRQRVAFALSEILVASDRPEQLAVEPVGMANFYDLMVKHAFGNYATCSTTWPRIPVMAFTSVISAIRRPFRQQHFPDEISRAK